MYVLYTLGVFVLNSLFISVFFRVAVVLTRRLPLWTRGNHQMEVTLAFTTVPSHAGNRRSSEIQGTALSKCLQARPVYTGPCLRV